MDQLPERPGGQTYRQLSSLASRAAFVWARSPHFVDQRINRPIETENSVCVVYGMPVPFALFEERTALHNLEMNNRSRVKAQFFADFNGNSDLPFGG
jgi:hypothetical protein